MNPQLSPALDALHYDRVLEIIADRAATDYGRKHILALYPMPLGTRQDRDFLRIEALTIALQRDTALSFEDIRDVSDAVKRCKVAGSFLRPGELLDIAGVLIGAARLRKQIDDAGDLLEALVSISERLVDAPDLTRAIHEKIDMDSAVVKDSASSTLKDLRRSLQRARQKSRRSLDDMLKRYGEKGWLLETGYTVEDDRFVLAVKSPHRNKVRGIVHGHSASGGTVYIEPDNLVELGNEIRRLTEEELAEIRKILTELTDGVREHRDDLRSTMGAVAELDSLQARALYADACGAMRPDLGGDELRLVEARHPLLLHRKGLKDTVPLSLHLKSDARVLVITGPNAGGKTVALITLGLVTAMAHAGIIPPVGADTTVPALDLWHVIIGDDQSLESDLSSFSGHLTRLNQVFTEEGAIKLVLVDEIAAGTDPTEGSTLAAAFMELLVKKRWWAVVTTHMGELKLFAHKTKGVRNGSMQFDRERLLPSYRFQPDTPGSSYALEIAERVGLPQDLIRRARELLGEDRLRMEDLIGELSGRLKETEDLQRELEIQTTKTSGLQRVLQERLDTLDREKKKLAAEAAREAELLLKDANRAVERAVKEIRENQASREAIKHAHDLVDQQKAKMEDVRRGMTPERRKKPKKKATPEPAPKPKPPARPKPAPQPVDATVRTGSRVKLENGEKGDVLALQGQRAQVAVGSIKLWLPVDQLTVIQGDTPKRGGIQVMMQPADDEPVGMELDLRGKRYEEAEEELAKYLESLELAGMQFARIVHGKGTGALRSMVRKLLRQSGGDWSYRDGEPGEGGEGVTVIQR